MELRKKGQAQNAVVGLIAIVIFILILTALGPTIVDNTDTAASQPLENASGTSKQMYSLIELLYPIIGVIVFVTVGFALGRRL